MTDLRYPIGKFHYDRLLTDDQRRAFIDDISQAPSNLRTAVKGLSEAQLDTPYRPGGWTVRQTAHHVPDSHMNAYIRFKLALTEEDPTIKPYAEDRWGGTGGYQVNSDRRFFDAARFAARPLGAPAAIAFAGRVEALVPPP